MHGRSEVKRLLDKLLHRRTHRAGGRAGRAVVKLEKIRLHVLVAGVKDELKLRAVGHLRQVVVAVHHLGDIENLIRE